MAEKTTPKLVIKEVKKDGSEVVVSEVNINNNTANYTFPENTGDDDISYNIYYDDGNGCTATESIVVKAGEECKEPQPPEPEKIPCKIEVRANAYLEDIIFHARNAQGEDIAEPEEFGSLSPSYFKYYIGDGITEDVYIYLELENPGGYEIKENPKKAECGGQVDFELSRTITITPIVTKVGNALQYSFSADTEVDRNIEILCGLGANWESHYCTNSGCQGRSTLYGWQRFYINEGYKESNKKSITSVSQLPNAVSQCYCGAGYVNTYLASGFFATPGNISSSYKYKFSASDDTTYFYQRTQTTYIFGEEKYE